jgi:hypothetical protein
VRNVDVMRMILKLNIKEQDVRLLAGIRTNICTKYSDDQLSK